MRRAIGIALAALVLGAPAGAQQARFVGLGDLPGGPFSSAANGVSDDGSVAVGVSLSDSGTDEAFRWTSEGGMEGLGSPGGLPPAGAEAIDSAGSTIVGTSGTAGTSGEASRWITAPDGTTGAAFGLGFLPGGFAFSRAMDVSEDVPSVGPVIVGFGGLGSAESTEAFRWTQGSGIVPLSLSREECWLTTPM